MWNKWKDTLLDVFSDESTLTASMVSWCNAPVHQESEWWMDVWERCIYRHTNGEWSQ
jgi:hypothetical protein